MNRNESGIPYFHQTLWRTGGGWRVCYPDQWSVTTMSKGGILSIKLLLQHPHPQLERLQQPCHKFLARWGAPSSLWCSCKGSRPPGFPSPSSGRRRVVSCVGRAEGLTFSQPDVVPPSPLPLPSLWPMTILKIAANRGCSGGVSQDDEQRESVLSLTILKSAIWPRRFGLMKHAVFNSWMFDTEAWEFSIPMGNFLFIFAFVPDGLSEIVWEIVLSLQ